MSVQIIINIRENLEILVKEIKGNAFLLACIWKNAGQTLKKETFLNSESLKMGNVNDSFNRF